MKELNEIELKEVEGGVLWQLILLAAIVEILSDWNSFEQGLSGKPYQK